MRITLFSWQFIAVPLFVSLLLSGCVKEEKAKKVSLTKKNIEPVEEIEYPSRETLWFGFDLRLGPKEDVRLYIPLLKYLEGATGRRFRIKFSEKYEETIEDLGKGVTQFAALGTLNYITGQSKYGINYLVSGVNRNGDTTYHSVIFTSPKSDMQDLKFLKGKCFAFGSKMSTQGHLIPRKMLEDEGITLNDLGRHIYTGSHLETVKYVLNGECDAGGIQDVLADRLSSEGKIKILKISESYPGSLIAYSSSVDSRTVEAVRNALLALKPEGEHREILVDWDNTEMPSGFTLVKEPDVARVKELAIRYGLLKE